MLAKDALFRAEQVEQIAAEIYDLLSRQFSDRPEAEELFAQLAREERQHARRVQMLRVRMLQEPTAFGEARVDPSQMEALEEQGLEIKRRLAAGDQSTLEQAKAEMVALEERLAAAHVEALATITDPDIRSLFERLAEHDRAHAKLLAPVDSSAS